VRSISSAAAVTDPESPHRPPALSREPFFVPGGTPCPVTRLNGFARVKPGTTQRRKLDATVS
jgi:hypothetical protein